MAFRTTVLTGGEMPQFVENVASQLCVRFPRVPLAEIAERHGSGKLTLNKGGASGTRVWQCPWFMYPAFCDFLLGNVAPNPYFGAPRLRRPDVFNSCYPWLYCQEASVEGEDLLGVDLSLRAFYRRAIVTAKYAPLELNNSIHINAQMLTIPSTNFIFIGQNPHNLAGYQQLFTVEMKDGPISGGTFQLGFADDTTVTAFTLAQSTTGLVAAGAPETGVSYTSSIPYNASAAQVRDAVRKALGIGGTVLGFSLPERPDAVKVVGPEGKPGATGPWTITLNMPDVKTCYAKSLLECPAKGIFVNYGGHTRGIDAQKVSGRVVGEGGETPGGGPADESESLTRENPDDWWAGTAKSSVETAHAELYSLEWSAKYAAGSFQFKITLQSNAGGVPVTITNVSEPVDVGSAQPADIKTALRGALENYKVSGGRKGNEEVVDLIALWSALFGPSGQNEVVGTTVVSTGAGGTTTKTTPLTKEQQERIKYSPVRYGFDLDKACAVYLSQPYLDGAPLEPFRYSVEAAGVSRPIFKDSLSKMATNNGNRPIIMYFGFHTLKSSYTVTNVELVWLGSPTAAADVPLGPSVVVKKLDPYLGNRLDQNVGKVIPMGEFTFQRHQVLGADMIYLLSVVGSVNMFTFLGFPPWTLLLSGIEAKQTRLPNGTPAFDMTFKFAFNPYTHQAIFRPLYMRWEFVRGVLIARIPKNLMVPNEPLDPATGGRAKLNPKAVGQAYVKPKSNRIVPVCLNPSTGTVVTQGAGSVVGNLPSSPPPPAPDPPWGNGPIPFFPNFPAFGAGGETATTPFAPIYAPDGSTVIGFKPSPELLGADAGGGASANSNPNPQTSTPQASGGGEIQVPFGTVPAKDNRGNLIALLQSLGTNLSSDPNVPGDDPVGDWTSRANILGGMIAQSIAATAGSADEDVAAYNTGVAADMELGTVAQTTWSESLGPATLSMTGEDATGDLVNDIAYAKAAHACGARLCPATRELIGLPPDDGPAAGEALGAGPVPPKSPNNTSPSGSVLGAFINIGLNYAANIGAANSVQAMATRIFDLGLIYPICDFTPILFLQ